MGDNISNTSYLVAGYKTWNRRIFDDEISNFPGRWLFIGEREQLTIPLLKKVKPRYIFFLHWSWLVPKEIIENYECICFHMSDVPYGRGGSPLQNQIMQGNRYTKLTALRMVSELDAGPVYIKEGLSLEGNAEEIYIRASYLSAKMIRYIIEECPEPVMQNGDPTIFKRRKPSDSRIRDACSLQALHDFIRMLDADGYPLAFIEQAGFRYEFKRAALYDGRIIADVVITPIKGVN
jgi:methionyl-tRNA formyltransferase